MLQRLFVHLSLALLFALTQMNVATHEISHLDDFTQHSQQDKNTPNHQCEQCIGHADIANGMPSQAFNFAIVHSTLITPADSRSQFLTTNHHSYSARAPPLSS